MGGSIKPSSWPHAFKVIVTKYVETMDVAQAAQASGLSIEETKRVLDHPDIAKVVDALVDEQMTSSLTNSAYVITKLREVAEKSIKIGDGYAAIKALAEIRKAVEEREKRIIEAKAKKQATLEDRLGENVSDKESFSRRIEV